MERNENGWVPVEIQLTYVHSEVKLRRDIACCSSDLLLK